MAEQFTVPLQTQRTHIEESRIVIDLENKKITIEARIGNLDANNDLIDAQNITVMHRDAEFQAALNFLLPTTATDNIRATIKINARKLIKRYLEQQYNLPEDTL